MKNDELFSALSAAAVRLGAHKANVINVSDIVLECEFRAMCEANLCGVFGKCYMCPPDVGDIDVLMRRVGEFRFVLVYQIVGAIKGNFDFDGMTVAKRRSFTLAQELRAVFSVRGIKKALHLGVGGCGVCEVCAKLSGEPCRHPELALSSLEAYGVNVSELACAAGMRYINGENTVTYFGAVLFCL